MDMANWQRKIDISQLHHDFQAGTITVQQLAAGVAKKVRLVPDFKRDHIDLSRDEIAEEFEALSEDENADINDYDNVLSNLYDWADMSLDGQFNGKKVCWIETMGKVKETS